MKIFDAILIEKQTPDGPIDVTAICMSVHETSFAVIYKDGTREEFSRGQIQWKPNVSANNKFGVMKEMAEQLQELGYRIKITILA